MINQPQEKPIYRRILIKLSGEILIGGTDFGIDPVVLNRIVNEIGKLVELGVEVAIVIGGGNLFRGKMLSAAGLGRVTGDHMGMLATVMNGLALRDVLEKVDLPSSIMSAIPMTGVVDAYNRRKAIEQLRNKHVVIFTAGIGSPFFTTDSAACLRAIEIDADVVLKATKVDGIYTSDPLVNPDAKKFSSLTYDEILKKNLEVMDLTAICLCRDQNMPLCVFNINTNNALKNVVLGGQEGTKVGSG